MALDLATSLYETH